MRVIKRDMIDPNPRASLQIGGVQPTMAAEVLHTLRSMAELAGEMHVMLHVHLLEAEYNRQEEPLRALDLAGVLGPTLIGAHAVHVTDDEIALLARRGVRLAHCPLSNMRLASGIMRLGAIHAQGLRVGLGLDGGTNDTSDMFNNMRAAVGLQRAVTRNPAIYPTVADALHLATLGGAEVLDMADQIGSLAPGKQADIIVLNPQTLNFAPRFDDVSQVVFNAQPSNVEWVFVDGRVLKERGQLVGWTPRPCLPTPTVWPSASALHCAASRGRSSIRSLLIAHYLLPVPRLGIVVRQQLGLGGAVSRNCTSSTGAMCCWCRWRVRLSTD